MNKPRFGTLPDFGNFPRDKQGNHTIDIYAAIARMMPYAHGVSAKSYDFNPDGTEAKMNFARILKIVTDAGYHGYVGVEYEGSKLPEPEGIIATKEAPRSLPRRQLQRLTTPGRGGPTAQPRPISDGGDAPSGRLAACAEFSGKSFLPRGFGC